MVIRTKTLICDYTHTLNEIIFLFIKTAEGKRWFNLTSMGYLQLQHFQCWAQPFRQNLWGIPKSKNFLSGKAKVGVVSFLLLGLSCNCKSCGAFLFVDVECQKRIGWNGCSWILYSTLFLSVKTLLRVMNECPWENIITIGVPRGSVLDPLLSWLWFLEQSSEKTVRDSGRQWETVGVRMPEAADTTTEWHAGKQIILRNSSEEMLGVIHNAYTTLN